MKVESGKTYKSRDGRQYKVMYSEFCFRTFNDAQSWREDGAFFGDRESEHDLIEEVKEKVEFSVGDEVEWCGVLGKVENITTGNFYKPVYVNFPSEGTICFTLDGRYLSWHTETSLKLIKKAKKKVKKYKYAFLDI